MDNYNPFPESDQKAFLRRYHLNNYLIPHKERIGRNLTYFGLPSAEMYDVELWSRALAHIVAVERDSNTALRMYRTAQRIGVRERLTILEMDLVEAARILALEEKEAELSISLHSAPIARNVRLARSTGFDVLNIDMCGGFLYPKSKRSESSYEQMLRNLISYQARHSASFILIVTFSTRDTGKSEYEKFILETLKFLSTSGSNVKEVKSFYTAKNIPGHPSNLRRLRFCVPTYLHKISYEDFEVQGLSSWYYKTFYHTAFYFASRQSKGVLGPWPPVDELKDLLNTPLKKVIADNGEITLEVLHAPSIL
jgi:hypothetical protein